LALPNNKDRFEEAKRILDEANSLLEEDTIDSLLRYFQTGILNDNTHLPSILLQNDKQIQLKLARKLEGTLKELGFRWNEEKLKFNGEMELQYISGQYKMDFATLRPSKRSIEFHFDFNEMEREREIKLEQIKRKIEGSRERYLDSRKYIAEQNGISRIKNSKQIERLQESIKNSDKEKQIFIKEIEEINQQKKILEEIKERLEETKYKFRRYGFILEFFKGEEYDI
jgi:hypothetical protein